MEIKDLQYIINQGEGLSVEFNETEVCKSCGLAIVCFNLTWQQVLLQLVPSWHEKGTRLHTLNWPENQTHEEEKIKKVPRWHEKGTQLLKKKNWYLIAILSLCSLPIAQSELMAAFDYKNAKIFRDNYLKPLRESGFIVFTIPEKPTDPDNKYVITQQGKAFLGGLLN